MTFIKWVSTVVAAGTVLLASTVAQAAFVTSPTGCGGCGPVTTAEFFIVGDTGSGPFDSPGIGSLPAGWTATVVNPNYAVATGPSLNLSGWTEHYLGNIANSVEIDLFFWSGAPLSSISFAANYTRSGNGNISALHCQSFGAGCAQMNDPTGVNYDRAAVNVPEPATLALVGLILAGAAGTRRRRG